MPLKCTSLCTVPTAPRTSVMPKVRYSPRAWTAVPAWQLGPCSVQHCRTTLTQKYDTPCRTMYARRTMHKGQCDLQLGGSGQRSPSSAGTKGHSRKYRWRVALNSGRKCFTTSKGTETPMAANYATTLVGGGEWGGWRYTRRRNALIVVFRYCLSIKSFFFIYFFFFIRNNVLPIDIIITDEAVIIARSAQYLLPRHILFW